MVIRRDHCGVKRFVGARKRAQIARILNRGLPVTCRFRQQVGGGYSCVEFIPRAGFTHMSPHREVRRCGRNNYHCHCTTTLNHLMHNNNNNNNPQIQQALQRITNHLQNNPITTLQVAWVNPWSSVIHINPCPVLQPIWADMQFLRNTVGGHFGNMTVSM